MYHPMWSKTLAATGLALALALPAAAQQSPQSQSSSSSPSSSSNSGQQRPGTGGASNMSLRQHIKQDLEKAGFKDVQVMPTSFAARATDQQGRPVVTLIDPDSVMTITAVGSPGQSGSGQSGSGQSGSSGSGSGGSGSSNTR